MERKAQNTKHSIALKCFLSLLPSHSSLLSKIFVFFSHTLCASFLPCIRLLLFNSSKPDVHLITALPSRTTAENNLRLFSPAATASRTKYTPTDINTDNHCSDSLLSSLLAPFLLLVGLRSSLRSLVYFYQTPPHTSLKSFFWFFGFFYNAWRFCWLFFLSSLLYIVYIL